MNYSDTKSNSENKSQLTKMKTTQDSGEI